MRAVDPALAGIQMRAILLLLLCAVVYGSVPLAARAETALGVRAGVGPTFPQGDLGEVTNTGVHWVGIADIHSGSGPLAIEILIAHQNFRADRSENQFRDWILTGGIQYAFLRQRTTLYGVLGIGPYIQRYDYQNWQTRLGANAGLGIAYDLGDFDLFVEARAHQTFPTDFGVLSIPVVAGIWLRP